MTPEHKQRIKKVLQELGEIAFVSQEVVDTMKESVDNNE